MAKPRKRMLIVDDNDMTRALLRGLLRNEEEYDVVGEATNGETAVELAQRHKPDIIFLDVDMPKMGGLEALAKIREISPQTVVLMVTAHTERETVQTAIANGAAEEPPGIIGQHRQRPAVRSQNDSDAKQDAPGFGYIRRKKSLLPPPADFRQRAGAA